MTSRATLTSTSQPARTGPVHLGQASDQDQSRCNGYLGIRASRRRGLRETGPGEVIPDGVAS